MKLSLKRSRVCSKYQRKGFLTWQESGGQSGFVSGAKKLMSNAIK